MMTLKRWNIDSWLPGVRHGERKGSGVTTKEGHQRDLGGDGTVLYLAGSGGDVNPHR